MLFAGPSRFHVTVGSGWDILLLLAVMLFDVGFSINFCYFLPSESLMRDLFMTLHKLRSLPGCKIFAENRRGPLSPGCFPAGLRVLLVITERGGRN